MKFAFYFCSFFIATLSFHRSFAQNVPEPKMLKLEVVKDTICLGEQLLIRATGTNSPPTWTYPANTLQRVNETEAIATPQELGTIKYSATATVPLHNPVLDGRFDVSKYNSPKFETVYQLIPDIKSSFMSDATIGKKAATYQKEYCKDSIDFYATDHGDFLLGNVFASFQGPLPADWGTTKYIWKQSNLNVLPNSTYEFRLLAADWKENASPNNVPEIQLYVNGQALMTTSVKIGSKCKWKEIKAIWNSGNLSSATIHIADLNAQQGTGFAIDDISFGIPTIQSDTLAITTRDCFYVQTEKENCQGDSIRLLARTNGYFSGWTSNVSLPEIVSPDRPMIVVHPTATTRYTASAELGIGNLITNGSFSLGNTGFTSDLIYSPSLLNGGQYVIGSNPSFYQALFVQKNDHSLNDSLMMIVDGNTTTGSSIYSTNVTVQAGKPYVFSFWATNIHREPSAAMARMSFAINGIKMKEEEELFADTSWHQFHMFFRATFTGPITLSLINASKEIWGNDYALDDIVFAPLYHTNKSSTIEAAPCIISSLESHMGSATERIWFDKDNGVIKTEQIATNTIKAYNLLGQEMALQLEGKSSYILKESGCFTVAGFGESGKIVKLKLVK